MTHDNRTEQGTIRFKSDESLLHDHWKTISTETALADRISLPRTHSKWVAYIAYALAVIIIAANSVAIRFSNRELPPFWGAGTRFAAASIVFFLYVAIRRLPLPRGRDLVGAILFGMLQFGIAFSLGYWALVKVPAGLWSVILASVPLFTLLFASVMGLEKLHVQAVLGALVAMGGIALLFGEQAGKAVPILYLLAAMGAAAALALAGVVVKAYAPGHPAATNAIGMLTGALVLIGLSLAAGEAELIPSQPATWAAWIYLALPGSVGGFGLLLFLLKRWSASAVSYTTVLSPLIAIPLSAWVLGEALTGGLFLGALFVLLGVTVGILLPQRRKPGKVAA